MKLRSRTRRALKWIATGLCVIIVVIWLVSTHWTISYTATARGYGVSLGSLELVDITHPEVVRGWLVFRHPKQGLIHWPRTVHASWGTSTMVPLWLFFVPVALPTATLWWLDRRRYPPGHCQKCGYDLTGNVSGRCPECGSSLDPRDAAGAASADAKTAGQAGQPSPNRKKGE